MKNELQADDSFQGQKSLEDTPFVRRSTRLASKPPQQTITQATMSGPRRNPKRKASEAANELNHRLDSEQLLDEALAPLSLKDVEEWEGWVELESEPAFFNIILRDLGVRNVKAQEIFTIDQDSLAFLPQPVYGLIFLFQYLPGLEEESEEQDATGVWFANQTTSNACATVAMLNIVMNAEGIDLGEKLRAFKESTRDLNTALRGHQISQNNFIRTIHNSFTRRMDHLNADLCLENEVSDAKTSTSKRRTVGKKGKKAPPRKKKSNTEYGYHFIAYVPASGYVWELDGLQYKPRKLDHVPDTGDWTSVAGPQIQGRMLQYEESQLSFNLLALCQSPLTAHSQTIAQAAASLRYLHENTESLPTFKDLISAEAAPLDIEDDSRLSDFNLAKADIMNAHVPNTLQEKLKRPSFDTQSAYELHQELVVDVKAAMGEYRSELMAISDNEQRVKGRKKDYGPALHKWIQKLAEKGVLEEVIKAT
ncbi:ubiquitin carboxyl-terminal hydrolase isozyme L5 [Fusarium pseudocircinatum]|uniref:Ubiquitin carboxyl-terminal hydrolase n=1 Tax=Fusarium pseudocircinatum TaxID=56676 RepID=A0A8H5V0Q4_9HYPO|nr:ubiquitin carboxyl-terminal hydrolase isozyme L5 [Fusarium pseudocircinatum]